MVPTPSLERFQSEHDRIWELLLRYQECLMASDLDQAGTVAAVLVYELAVHMGVEEQVLLPIFVEKGLESEGARLPLFLAEHRKLGELADGLAVEVRRLKGLEDAGKLQARDRLDGIELAYTFKHLFHHHSQREDQGLYPALDEAVGRTERADIWERMDDVEGQARLRLGDAPSALPAT